MSPRPCKAWAREVAGHRARVTPSGRFAIYDHHTEGFRLVRRCPYCGALLYRGSPGQEVQTAAGRLHQEASR